MKISENVLRKLYIDDKLSCNEISDIYNIPPSSLRYTLHRIGVKLRNRSECLSNQWSNKRRSYSDDGYKSKILSAAHARTFINDCSYKKQSRTMSSKHPDKNLVIINKNRVGTNYWRKISKRIILRDGRQCVTCGNDKMILNVHHINPYGGDGDENLITLCQSCHAKETWNFIKNNKYPNGNTGGYKKYEHGK